MLIRPLLTAASGGGTRPQSVFAASNLFGTGANQQINTNFSPSLIWAKALNFTSSHELHSAVRGINRYVSPDASTAGEATSSLIQAVNTFGFVANTTTDRNLLYWALKIASGFLDIQVYTGNGVNGRQIAHGLGTAPGFIAVFPLSGGNAYCYHRSLGPTKFLLFNTNDAPDTVSTAWAETAPTSANFTVGTLNNQNGQAYLALLLAHDPTPAGLTVSGTFTTDGSGAASVPLLWRPQAGILKAGIGDNWIMLDTTRGWGSGADKQIFPNSPTGQNAGVDRGSPTSTGFTFNGLANMPYTYTVLREAY